MKIVPWEKLSRARQDRYLTVLWEDGYSEQAIADFLGTTKGRVVRRRQTSLKLPTVGRQKKGGPVDPERFADLLDLKDMEELEANGVSSIAPPSPHEVKEAEQGEEKTCKWPLSDSTRLKPKLCGKPAVPGHSLCEEHLAQVRSSL